MTITDSIKAEIEEGHRLRGYISNAYAQIEFLLGDLAIRCRAFPEYAAETATFTHSASKRIAKVRRMLKKEGPLSPYVTDLTTIVERFEQGHATRNLLAHGYCVYLHTPAGDAGFQFQMWHRQKDRDDARLIQLFRLSDLQAEKESFVSLAEGALHFFRRMHIELGWLH